MLTVIYSFNDGLKFNIDSDIVNAFKRKDLSDIMNEKESNILFMPLTIETFKKAFAPEFELINIETVNDKTIACFKLSECYKT